MRNKELRKLVAGFNRFRTKYYVGEDSLYSKLSTGQNPKSLVIGCSDSRVDPALITSASPGELFVVRNVANIVPPVESSRVGFHGISSAIEFAVVNLKVENVIILGHRQCGGIRALVSGQPQEENSFISRWMQIIHGALERVNERSPGLDFDEQCKECEKEGIVTSLENLKSFPFVQDAIESRGMRLFGIYFDLEQGILMEYDEPTKTFREIKA